MNWSRTSPSPIQPPLDDLAPGTRAVIYLRVSSTGQVRTDYNPEGISIPAQREAFQHMLARIRSQSDVDVIIIYQLSRMARNRYDDAIVMADLRKRRVTWSRPPRPSTTPRSAS
jgi:site-specific DNA recombinase